jgi:hypothetical protein
LNINKYFIFTGFDCSLPRICCGTEIDRYCCIPSTALPSSSPPILYQSIDDLDYSPTSPSNNLLAEKWFFIQMCTISIFLAIILLLFVIIYLCLTSIHHTKREKKMSIVQIPLPTTSSNLIEPKRSISNRTSIISSASSDAKSRCTDTSIVINTPLNLYPTDTTRNSTVSSSSYYTYPNEFEYLCK